MDPYTGLRIRILTKQQKSWFILIFFILDGRIRIRTNTVIPDTDPGGPKTSVADPGSGAFLTPGSGMGRKSASGSGMNNTDHIF
jgi:hypothetical protein